MKIENTNDVMNLLRIYIASTALGTALELGLFWQLAESPLGIKEISQKFNIPSDRCRSWLELLTGLGLLEHRGETYTPSSTAHSTILEAYSSETWAQLAQEARERYQAGNNLALHISHPDSVWVAQGIEPPRWFTQIMESPKRAERFTRMLYELHLPLAEKVAQNLDMTDVKQLMDLGGGSGVVSLALLKRHPNLTAVVVDIDTVCKTGREIANETPMANRITYHAADFLQDKLPIGFDMILECDVAIYSEELFSKLRSSLNGRGRLVIISNLDDFSAWFEHAQSKISLLRLMNSFLSSLGAPRVTKATIEDVKNRLTKVGFHNISEQIWEDDTVIIQAHK
ncbi:MAG: methyltransferase [Promethearchaeota archaeon]